MENGLHSNQTDIYLTSVVIGQKSTNQIAQYIHGRKLVRFSHAVIDVRNIRKAFACFQRVFRHC